MYIPIWIIGLIIWILAGSFCAYKQGEENEKGELWVDNKEYGTRVNWCPFCRYEAKNKDSFNNKCKEING